MIVDKIKVAVGITKSLGKGSFEFVRLDAEAGATLQENDDPEEAFKTVWKLAQDQVESQLTEVDEAIA